MLFYGPGLLFRGPPSGCKDTCKTEGGLLFCGPSCNSITITYQVHFHFYFLNEVKSLLTFAELSAYDCFLWGYQRSRRYVKCTRTNAELEQNIWKEISAVLIEIIWYLLGTSVPQYTRVNKNPSAWNFLSPKPEVTCGTVAIIIRVVLLSPYLRIRSVSLSSIHYNQSHRVQ